MTASLWNCDQPRPGSRETKLQSPCSIKSKLAGDDELQMWEARRGPAQEGLPACWPPAERAGSTSPSAKRPLIRILVLCSGRDGLEIWSRLCLSRTECPHPQGGKLLTLTLQGFVMSYKWGAQVKNLSPSLADKHSVSISPFLHCLCPSSCPMSLLF